MENELVTVFDFSNCGERYLHYLAVGTLNLDARSRQCLRGFHAPHNAAYPPAFKRDDLDIVFAIERPEYRQSFGDFHGVSCPSELKVNRAS
jgi:hypothetical protein